MFRSVHSWSVFAPQVLQKFCAYRYLQGDLRRQHVIAPGHGVEWSLERRSFDTPDSQTPEMYARLILDERTTERRKRLRKCRTRCSSARQAMQGELWTRIMVEGLADAERGSAKSKYRLADWLHRRALTWNQLYSMQEVGADAASAQIHIICAHSS